MKFIAFFIFIACLSLINLAIAQDNNCSISKDALLKASQLRGLAIKEEPPCLIKDKEQVKQYLVQTINTRIPRERMVSEALIYKAFGFIPRNYNYEEGILKLYLDQLGGYYDPEQNSFTMAAWIPAILQVTVAVHELTHALQDQHYNLEKFMDLKSMTSDALLARSALVEGDATAVMIDYSRNLLGQGSLSSDPNVTSLMLQNIIGTSMFATLRDVPESLKLTLLFPYTSGLRFVHTFLARGGYKEVDKLFLAPPRSTEEILHPEKYSLNVKDFSEVAIDTGLAGSDFRSIYQDTLGEFSISVLLANFETNKEKAAAAAAGWGGDKVEIFQGSASLSQRKVIWTIAWDTAEDAKEFFDLYSKSVIVKLPDIKISMSDKKTTLTYQVSDKEVS